jgi:hypothetical protein
VHLLVKAQRAAAVDSQSQQYWYSGVHNDGCVGLDDAARAAEVCWPVSVQRGCPAAATAAVAACWLQVKFKLVELLRLEAECNKWYPVEGTRQYWEDFGSAQPASRQLVGLLLCE